MITDPINRKNPPIHGWLAFFLFQIGAGTVISVASTSIELNPDTYLGTPPIAYIGFFCDLLAMLGLAFGGVYTIYSVIKRKPNAVSLSTIYVCVVMVSNVAVLLTGSYETGGFVGSLQQIVVSLLWNIIWLLYLHKSEQVKEIFPVEKRVTKKADFILLLVVILPLAWLGIFFLLFF